MKAKPEENVLEPAPHARDRVDRSQLAPVTGEREVRPGRCCAFRLFLDGKGCQQRVYFELSGDLPQKVEFAAYGGLDFARSSLQPVLIDNGKDPVLASQPAIP